MAVLPTKGNLIATKHSLELATTGYELMDRKRNILTREMMSLISKAEELQSRIDSTFTEAYDALSPSLLMNLWRSAIALSWVLRFPR
jgi:V/A-type H+-transporting ATPase subunit D